MGQRPLCIDLFCGLGGWTEGFLAEGWDVIGFDIERHAYGDQKYPAQLVLQDVLTLHGSQFRNADCIVASPPCQAYSYMAMPWSRAKREIRWQRWERTSPFGDPHLTDLFDACFRIQREACEAAGRHIPLVVENVKGAQPWVGRARANFGSFYFWGDVAMHGGRVVAGNLEFGAFARAAKRGMKRKPDGTEHPQGSWFAIADSKERGSKNDGGSWFNIAHNAESGCGQNPVGRKVGGIKLSEVGFNVAAAQRLRGEKTEGHANIRDAYGHTRHLTNQRESEALKLDRKNRPDYPYSPDDSRKAASAQIAKIPFPLASYIARSFKPRVLPAQAG